MIDDSRAKNIFINSTFTLKCFVHIEVGVIITGARSVQPKNRRKISKGPTLLKKTYKNKVNNFSEPKDIY
jgi:hypothetical protein